MKPKAAIAAAAALALAFLPGSVVAATPVEIVESFHQSLLAVMKEGAKTKPAGRYEQLAPAVESTFNLPFMIQIATGTKWRTASDDERAGLIAAFTRMSVGTYASRFDSFSGERFETLGEQDGPGGSRLVLTRIVRTAKEPVPITYVVRKFADEWRVIDVLVSGGISELAVRRSEYNAILSEAGARGLATRLNQKADHLLAP